MLKILGKIDFPLKNEWTGKMRNRFVEGLLNLKFSNFDTTTWRLLIVGIGRVTSQSLLQACIKGYVKENGLKDIGIANAMIEAAGRTKSLHIISKIRRLMEQENLQPNAVTYQLLLNSCKNEPSMYRKLKNAKKKYDAANEMVKGNLSVHQDLLRRLNFKYVDEDEVLSLYEQKKKAMDDEFETTMLLSTRLMKRNVISNKLLCELFSRFQEALNTSKGEELSKLILAWVKKLQSNQHQYDTALLNSVIECLLNGMNDVEAFEKWAVNYLDLFDTPSYSKVISYYANAENETHFESWLKRFIQAEIGPVAFRTMEEWKGKAQQ